MDDSSHEPPIEQAERLNAELIAKRRRLGIPEDGGLRRAPRRAVDCLEGSAEMRDKTNPDLDKPRAYKETSEKSGTPTTSTPATQEPRQKTLKVVSKTARPINRADKALIQTALAIQEQSAEDAGTLGYGMRALVQATLPHTKQKDCVFTRRNGNYSLTIMAPPDSGLPYGRYPRLILAWVCTEALVQQKRTLELGRSMTDFMKMLGLSHTGGRSGTNRRIRDQARRLFSSAISCTYSDARGDSIRNVVISDTADLWWNPEAPDQGALWNSELTLSERFYEELNNRPIPIDLRAVVSLRSPLAIDVYCWLTYRMCYLRESTLIPWDKLQMQFGSNYKSTAGGRRNFKKEFIKQLNRVLILYREARAEALPRGLLVKPSPTHIPSKARKHK